MSRLAPLAHGIVRSIALLLLAGSTWAAAPMAYIASCNDNSVRVIDTSSNVVAATVAVGSCPVAVAVTPDGSHVYVSNLAGNTVSVIATATNTVTATIPVGTPIGIAATPDGSRVYVSTFGGGLAVISTSTNTISATVHLAGGIDIDIAGVAVSPDGAFVYAASSDTRSDKVWVIATATNTVAATIPVGLFLQSVTVSPDGSRIYVTGDLAGVAVASTASNTVTALLPARGFTTAVSPDGARLYANSANGLAVFDTASNTLTATVPTCLNGSGVSVRPDGARVYVVCGSPDNDVVVVDAATNAIAASVPVGPGASTMGQFVGPASAPTLEQQLHDLLVLVTHVGPGNSLAAKVSSALAAVMSRNSAVACRALDALAQEVRAQTGKKISAALAVQITGSLAGIRATLNC